MGKFIVKRLLLCVVIFFFAMFLIYTLIYNLPSSYVETTARELAAATAKQGGKTYQEWLEQLNEEYGMNKGVVKGYFTWLSNALRGDFGDSWKWNMKCTDKFAAVIWNSFTLGLISFIFEIIIAIPLGVIAAKKQYSITDYTVTCVSLIGISLPTFFVATVLKLVFSVKLGWFDINGMHSRDFIAHMATGWENFADLAKHFVLPAITLIIVSIGGLMRYTRTNMLEVLNADYIRTARAKGLSEAKVVGYHAFRNTLIPVVTMLGGTLPGLFAGAMITETLFAIEGIGYISYTSMVGGDIPFTMFYLSLMSVLTLLGNLISDILYAVVDPRVRVN